MENYERMKIATLKNIAREKGLRGYSRLKKSELIRKLREPIQLRDHTRTQLIRLARERGLTRYHSLRKAELIQRLGEHGSTILDRGISARMANVPILTPTPYTPPPPSPPPPPPPPPSPAPIAVEDLEDYLVDVSASPRVRELQEEIKSIYEQMELFKVRESNSALKNFARVYTINGIEGYDARAFLFHARRNITKILRNNRNTKVKLILRCDMIHSIKDIIREFAFHSDINVNLEGTDEDDIYVIMTERILEKIARLINGDGGGGTGWAFYGVNKLELHTVSYKPLRGKNMGVITQRVG